MSGITTKAQPALNSNKGGDCRDTNPSNTSGLINPDSACKKPRKLEAL